MKIALNNKFPEKRILSTLSKIQKVYFVFVCLGFFVGLLIPFVFSAAQTSQINLLALFNVVVYLCVYLGIRRRKGWLIPLVLLFSIYQLYGYFKFIFLSAESAEMVLGKFLAMGMIWFYVYQVYFFTRREVKSFFGVKGKILF